jgi:hypothetical protein
MKPPLFHIGQHVVAIEPITTNSSVAPPQSKQGAVYQVNWVGEVVGKIGWFICCVEWDQRVCCEERGFAPAELLPDEALAQLLEEVFEPVTT